MLGLELGMRIFRIICSTVAIAAAQTPWLSHAKTGNELLIQCRIAEKSLDDPDPLPPEDQVEGAFCLGFVYGVAQVQNMLRYDAKVPSARICLPQNATLEQLVHIVVKFLRENPNMTHQDATGLTMVALKGAFPCY